MPHNNNNTQAIIPYQGRPTEAVEQIMRRVVSHNSSVSYRNNNIIFLLWLYDNEETREELLQDWMVEKMDRAVSLDEASDRSRRSRPAVRRVCKQALDNINKTDKNCPIVLTKLTFNLFSHYLTTRKNKKGNTCQKLGMLDLEWSETYLSYEWGRNG